MKVIAIEEHFYTKDFIEYLRSRRDSPRLETIEDVNHKISEKLEGKVLAPNEISDQVDLNAGRIKAMDEAGIDIQVLSLGIPGVEAFDRATGNLLAQNTNNQLYKTIMKHPDRFAGFASLAPQDPDKAANELERTTKQLGFKGAMINSNINGEYLDDNKYWIIFETAERLNVPIYIHPRMPGPDMRKPYIKYMALSGSMWGFGADAGLHVMRLILSGVFDRYPRLKIILGHLGEALPFWLWRLDSRWRRGGIISDPLACQIKKLPSQYIKDNFWVTTSGMLWLPAFICTHMALGADRILFAADYPLESSQDSVNFIKSAPIPDDEKEKIFHLNAENLLDLC